MTDLKYTDDEIRVLDYLLMAKDIDAQEVKLSKESVLAILAIVRRQKSEIARLQKYDEERDIRLHARLTENAKAEAVKEFAERLKERHYFHASCIGNCYQMYGNDIDTLVKEMTGEKGCPDCKYFVGCEAACGGRPCDGYTEANNDK